MYLRNLKVGKPVELYLYRRGYRYHIASKIERVSEKEVWISLITKRGKVFEFLESDKIELLYKSQERMWKWKNMKGNICRVDGIRMHSLTALGLTKGESFNRRNAYRVFVGEKVNLAYYVLPVQTKSEQEPDNKEFEPETANVKAADKYVKEYCPGFIKDISENGAGVFSNHIFQLKEEITFSFTSEFGVIHCKGKVVRMLKAEQKNYQYYYGCFLTETSRNLLKYIFELQRRQLKFLRNGKDEK